MLYDSKRILVWSVLLKDELFFTGIVSAVICNIFLWMLKNTISVIFVIQVTAILDWESHPMII